MTNFKPRAPGESALAMILRGLTEIRADKGWIPDMIEVTYPVAMEIMNELGNPKMIVKKIFGMSIKVRPFLPDNAVVYYSSTDPLNVSRETQ